MEKKKAYVCREFRLVNSKIQTIWKNRTGIISAFEQNGSRIKRLRKPERSDIDDALVIGISNREVTVKRWASSVDCKS
jgi:hypothetical protein